MKKALKIIGIIVAVVVVIVLIYVAYVFISYKRIPDNQALKVNQNTTSDTVAVGKELKMTTFNIGYGSYPPDYTFFMDGGKESKARNKKGVIANVNGVIDTIKKENPDFAVFQEVDEDATRSRHVDEVSMIEKAFSDMSSIEATNYDSAYLMYPVLDPIGKSKSGIITLSSSKIEKSTRYSLPIETTFNKFFDLDRCFTVSKIKASNGKYLMLYNVHLSAYMKDAKKQKQQIDTLFKSMSNDYAAGNYVVCGGDFNHDLLPSSVDTFNDDTSKGDYSWLAPFPTSDLPKGISVAPFSKVTEPVPSTRNLDTPYKKGKSFVALIDGFIVSDNVEVKENKVIDAGFQNT
ncbi:MAG: hydrolase, partial [Lachnospiraceae bacterium]|nr:hydrolase [Lachnospiraceae bacterium]